MMNPKFRLSDRLRYWFDNYMSRGTGALVGGLALITVALVLVISLITWGLRLAPDMNLPTLLWTNLLQALAPNPVDASAGSWKFLLSMLVTTLAGIFLVSIFIGVLTTGIEDRIQSLRKGRSRVIESGHTVILGWSSNIFTVISELVIANQNHPKACIVILGNDDKVEMEDEIREMIGHTGRTHIVCRTGNPIEMADLDLVSLNQSRSVIVLSPEDDDPDSSVIKIILAITNNPHRRSEPYHIVAEIHDPKYMEVARMVGKDEVELVLVGDLVARIIAQTCRQSGLSVVYTELLNFEGDEIYFQEEPSLTGQTFKDSLLAYEDSTIIGLQAKGQPPRLNPSMDTVLQPGDRLIAISEDDDTVRLSGRTDFGIDPACIVTAHPQPPSPERTLILGWNWRAPSIINELEQYVPPGSEVCVVAAREDGKELIDRRCPGLKNQTVCFINGDTTDRRLLDTLQIASYNHVIILCYSEDLPIQQADARTLVTLLHLRDMAEKTGRSFSITSEMLDIHNRNLADVTRADDFIVSDALVSLLMAQVSENKALNAVFKDLFDPEGSEIYLKPASQYVKAGSPVNFYTVVEAARQRGEVAIGYRLQALAGDSSQAYGVVVNPDKSKMVTFSEHDRIVVLAES
jgi:voltage-gated potassium channel Kch